MKCLRKLFGLDEKPRPHTVYVKIQDGSAPKVYHWVEEGANGEITCHGETHTRHADAERSAKAHVAAQRVYVDG